MRLLPDTHVVLRWLTDDPVLATDIAQALHEGLTLVTRDDRIQKYDVPILVA